MFLRFTVLSVHNDGEYLCLSDSTCQGWKATGDTKSGFNSHDRFYLIWAATTLITSEQAILFQLEINFKNAHGSIQCLNIPNGKKGEYELNCLVYCFICQIQVTQSGKQYDLVCPLSFSLNQVVVLCGEPGDIWHSLTPCSPLNFVYRCEHLRPHAGCSGGALRDQLKSREW